MLKPPTRRWNAGHVTTRRLWDDRWLLTIASPWPCPWGWSGLNHQDLAGDSGNLLVDEKQVFQSSKNRFPFRGTFAHAIGWFLPPGVLWAVQRFRKFKGRLFGMTPLVKKNQTVFFQVWHFSLKKNAKLREFMELVFRDRREAERLGWQPPCVEPGEVLLRCCQWFPHDRYMEMAYLHLLRWFYLLPSGND